MLLLSTSNARVARRLACCAGLLFAACWIGCADDQTSTANLPGDPAAASATPVADGKSADDTLRDRLDAAVDFTYSKRRLSTNDQAAWQIVHGILTYGRDYKILHDGKLVGATEYLLGGGELRGWNFRKSSHGVEMIMVPGSKTGAGHPDQWLGYLSQCGFAPEETFVVGGQPYKVADLITEAQWHLHDKLEATWTLMALSTYLPLDAAWTAQDGTEWSVARIVGMEAKQDLGESACGGSHRLYGLCVALNRHLAENGKLEGPWKDADDTIQRAVAKVKEYQNPDGSFSVNFFERPATSADVEKRINSTGHTLEFLTLALTNEQIKEPWMARAASHLVGLLEHTQDLALECGSLYHAVHGLKIYRERVFGPRETTSTAAQGAPANEPAPPASEDAAASIAAPASENADASAK